MLELKPRKASAKVVAVCSPCPQWYLSKKDIDALCKGAKVVSVPFMCTRSSNEKLKGLKEVGVIACGAGVQAAAEVVENAIPLCDTRSIFVKNGVTEKYCASCGDCILEETEGLCVYRCPKSIRNGPCGGVRPGGKCEVAEVGDCVWVKIFEKLHKNNFLRLRGKVVLRTD